MPAVSVAQRQLFAIAEHRPEQLYARNKGLKKMTHKQLHEFASTSEKNLPSYKAAHKARKNGGT